jgi:Dolichyl-phosphate-mannose-protein mannosyltransferase
LIFFSLIIAAGLFGLGRVVIGRLAPLESNPWLYKALTVCLVLHLIGAPVEIWVIDHLYGGIADYNRYDAQGAVLANGFRHLDFSLAPAHLKGIVSDGSVSIVAGVVFAIIGVNQLGAFLVFSWLSFIGIVFFYLAFTTTFGGAGSRRPIHLIFFLPTLIFWTSDVSKEAMMTFLMGLTAYGCARVLAHRGGYWMVVLGSAGGVFIRPNEVLLAIGGFTLAMLFRPADPNTKFAGPRRTVALIVLGSMLGVAIFVTLHFLPGTTNGSISLTEIAKNNNSAKGAAGFGSSNLGYSPSIAAYPKDVYSVLFDPLPINAHGGGQWISAVENSVLIWLILTSLRQLRILPRVALARTYVIMCLFFTASFLYAFAALGNLGLITRERTVMLPFLLVILCIPRGPRHRPPRYEWELPRRARIERRRAMALRPSGVRRRRAAPS